MQDHLDQLDALIARFEAELSPLAAEALDRRPEDDGWTARECVGHLVITVELYGEKLAALLESEADKRDTGPSKPTFVARMILGLLRKEGARKKSVKAPGVFRPDGATRPFEVAELVAVHRRFASLAAKVRDAGLGRRKIATPISRFLKLRACDALEITVLHGRRHLEQALRAAA